MNSAPHRYSLVDQMPAVVRQGSRDTCAAAAAVVLADYRFGAGTRLSVQYLFVETAKREQEWMARNISALRNGGDPDDSFKTTYPIQLKELELVREAAGAGSDEERSFLDVFESCQNKRLRGQSLRRCLETLAESGVCRNSLWPYDPNATDRAAVELPEGTGDDARQRRIARRSIYMLSSPGNVDEVKGLVCGLNGRLPAPVAVTLSAADPKRDPLGHAMVVVGYEDDPMNPGEGWFLLQNSWGTEWGDGGYGKIPYAEFSRRCVEAGALVAPRRRGLVTVLSVAAAVLLAVVIFAVSFSSDRDDAGPDWWMDAPWTNGTLNVCADISKGSYDVCPSRLRNLYFGEDATSLDVMVGRCLFGLETLDLSSTQVLFLFARSPSMNYTAEQKQVIRSFLESGGAVFVFLCECNFDCMGDLLSGYGLKLHRHSAQEAFVGAVPQTRRFDIEGMADAIVEATEDGWTTLVETESVHPHAVSGCRRVGKGMLVYAQQKMAGRDVRRFLNSDFWKATIPAVVRACGRSVKKGLPADQSADDAPVRIDCGRTLICAPESLRSEACYWSERIVSVYSGDRPILLCDSKCQGSGLCGKRTFIHFGAFCPKFDMKRINLSD